MKSLSRAVPALASVQKIARLTLLLPCACAWWAASAPAAPRIDSVNRSTVCDGQGVDFSPYAEDDRADNAATSLAGAFTGHAAVPVSLNDNVALFEADQVSTVNPADLTFSGSGSVHVDQEGRFDAADVAGGAFFQGSGGSSFTVFFTLTNAGKVALSTSLTAGRTFSTGVNATGVGIFARIEVKRGTTVVWSRFIAEGTLTFAGDVALAAGPYQLSVYTGSNVSLNAAGPQFAETNGSFTISGKISETAKGGGGKK